MFFAENVLCFAPRDMDTFDAVNGKVVSLTTVRVKYFHITVQSTCAKGEIRITSNRGFSNFRICRPARPIVPTGEKQKYLSEFCGMCSTTSRSVTITLSVYL